MPGRDIIVIGGSAGGIEALTALVPELSPDLPAAVFVVLHLPTGGTSVLPNILSRAGRLRAVHAADGMEIEAGRVFVAPPDRHMLVKPGRIQLVSGPKENASRPAINPLFRTSAASYGPRVVGVVLSGTLDDGTLGLAEIQARGGTTVVQDPDDALFPSMPLSAIENVPVDHVVPAAKIGALLDDLVRRQLPEEVTMLEPESEEPDVTEFVVPAAQADLPGQPSGFTCPECNGALWEIRNGELIRFQCRVGHAYSTESLLSEQSSSLEAALWAAVRSLEESASLQNRLAGRARSRGHDLTANRFEAEARQAIERARIIRTALLIEGSAFEEVAAEDGLPRDPETGDPSRAAESREQQAGA